VFYRNFGLRILVIALVISFLGIISIYSSNYHKEDELWQFIYKRQILWVIIGLVLFFLVSRLNYRNLWDITYILYAAVLFLLFLVFLLGLIRLGAQRWLNFGWFNFQPAEIAKLIVVIFLARYFSRKSTDDLYLSSRRLNIARGFILPFLFIAIPTVMIIEQPDLGSGLVLVGVFLVMSYMAGIKLRYPLIFILLGVICAPILWHFLRDYQKDRLLVFLNPNIDPLGAGYTVIQSKIAIGSGGFFGKGWLYGTQSQLHFLPESHTDFIFATFAEEWGFVGSIFLLFLYYMLIQQGFRIAQGTRDQFGRLLAYGISTLLAMQVFINIAMNLGFAPVVGLPLPLMSYGGSSIITTFIFLGILVNIDKERAVF
jgi:rod shape determining protein RodA